MTSDAVTYITSRDNPQLKELRRLTQDPTAYRKQGRVWLEGDHLCRAALARGLRPVQAFFTQSAWPEARETMAQNADRSIVIADGLWEGISALESPARMGFVLALPISGDIEAGAPTVILDRVQDAGNVGSILRSAAAFGYRQVIAIKGTAALWSPKVLRSGMGAHFALQLVESVSADALDALKVPVIVTSSHQGELVHRQALPWPCAWALGHEGQGVGEAVAQRASLAVRIGQPGGEESLNVAAAAAICLHAGSLALANAP